uniref:Uncharacterized protein n=1 Tax=Rhizophora mucronata TaxID=61149 RepID=A0A2P2PV80_RHIMU
MIYPLKILEKILL